MLVIQNIISHFSFPELLIAATFFFLGSTFGISIIKVFLLDG